MVKLVYNESKLYKMLDYWSRDEQKVFFVIFEGLSVAKNSLRPGSPSLKVTKIYLKVICFLCFSDIYSPNAMM